MTTRSLSIILVTTVGMALLGVAQPPPPVADRTQDRLVSLLKEVRAQQADLVANQAKIDERLAAVAESVRQARIYSSRSGK